MTVRHSVYFDTCEAANRAEAQINEEIAPIDLYQSNDGETSLIEVRFFTENKLNRCEQTRVVHHASTYALNCENEERLFR